ncbi:methylmalonyl-CoA mutase subunit beta [Mumia sp. zg.B53]|uniref:methylmalonyl-CoA mutase family protein n=1 Tax=Mumia sp. zg.B53 TaxID=2855449 RepID=UPI001C6EDB95|nr:methylmalonyl-CoA mutase family protein [Mumia sp. zg.B53]MBW9215294.1 methylmalonyl-CoA mutase subunit beta [Mumia sp. zg.B53]
MSELSLSGGAVSSREAWEKAAAAVLRKARRLSDDQPDAAVWEALTTRTLDGIAVTPLGTPELAAGLPDPGLPGQAPYVRGTRARRDDGSWDIRVLHEDPDATHTAEAVLDDLENGATSVWLRLGPEAIDPAALGTVLDRVFVDLAPVVVEARADGLGAADAFCRYLDERGVTPAPGTNLGLDPIGASLRGYTGEMVLETVVVEGARKAAERGIAAFVVDATAAHDGGASEAQEVGYALAVGAAYLRLLTAAGFSVEDALAMIEFRFAATDEQFTTIAKLRAARGTWNRLAELCGAADVARGQVQHVVTSRVMLSKYDPWVNMLRTTVAAFAAGVGGASSVTVLPFDAPLGLPDAFSRRIARNTSSLLTAEAHVGAVTDPAGGAYAVERLTDDLARAAWDELGRIEEAGGAVDAIEDGSLVGRHRAVARERESQIARRKRPLTGLSEFPNLREVLPERTPYPEGAEPVQRYGAAFEALRDNPVPTPVFLATMGPISAHTARVTFIASLLAAGGIETVTAGPTARVDAVLAAYDGAPVVCLAGPDSAYAEWGADLVTALRAAGAQWVILAGKPVDGVAVDATAATGVDALAFLHETRGHLGAARAAGGPAAENGADA